MSIRWACVTLVMYLVSGWPACAVAGEVGGDWASRVWQVDDGLPAANVAGIAQTTNGYLWLATQAGLARFDGAQFEVVPISAGRTRPIIRVMLRDHTENFWLAVNGGAVIRYNPETRVAFMFSATNGLPNALALQMIETPDHTVWISYADNSVFCITPDNRVTRITTLSGLNEDGTCAFTLDAHGVLWFAKGLRYGFFSENHFTTVGTLGERNPQILGSRTGGIWICTPSQLCKAISNSPPVTVARFEADSNRMRPSALYEDIQGRLWIGTASDGLFLLDHTNLFKVETSQNKIRAIMQDREGSIWVGTDGGGLNRLQPRVVELIGRDQGLPFETVRSMAEDGAGNLWVVTQDGALTRLPDNDWTRGNPVEDWPGGIVHCVVSDKEGAMWIGTYQHGLYCWQNDKYTRFDRHNGLGGGSIRSLMVDSRNDLWIGLETEHFVQRYHDGEFHSYQLPANSRAVSAMAEDSSGQIWMGTLDGRLLQVSGDTLLEVLQPTSDPPYPIRCLSVTPDGSLWIGYAVNGICRLKAGKPVQISPENGLMDGNICALMPDNAGRMWFASDRGIYFVTLAQLNNFADGKDDRVQSISYGRDAGLPGLQAYYGYWPGALFTRKEEILFPTHSGIAVVYPDHVRANRIPPNVLIQSVLVDGQTVSSQDGQNVRVAPNHKKFEISFTAPSFVSPREVRFRYRLKGWTEDWSEAERGHPAVFSRLPPGNYTFQVTACNNYGVWNEKGAVFHFAVLPFIWQRWWFRIPAMLIFVMMIAGVVRYASLRHVRQMMKRVEQEAALQKERTRIAQDMHDELGARFTQISLLGELSRNSLRDHDQAQDLLGQISRVAQTGVKSLDEIVWAVNPRNDTLPELLDYTGQYALDFVKSAGLQCRLDFPDAPSPFEISGDIRHAVFLIVKESLHNVVKHSQATRVQIGFELAEAEMLWRIDDDGKGFEPAAENALEDGLRNIRQRAAALGGHAEILSQPGKGTRVTVRIPLHK